MPNNKQSQVLILFCIATTYLIFGSLIIACSPSPENNPPSSVTATNISISSTTLHLTSIPFTPTIQSTQTQTITDTSTIKTVSRLTTFGKFDSSNSWVKKVAISNDETIVAAIGGENDQLTVWNISDGKEQFTIEGHNDWDFAISPNGHLLASTNWQDDNSWIIIRDTRTGQKLQRIHVTSSKKGLAFSPDGNVLAIGGRAAIWLWDIQNNTLLSYLGPQSDSISALAFSSDGKQLVSVGDYSIQLWDINSRKALKTFKLSKDYMYYGASISPGNPDFLSIFNYRAFYDNKLQKSSVEIWDITSGSIICKIKDFDAAGTPLAISPDGKFLIVTQNTKTQIWDTSSGKAVYKFPIDWAVFAFSIHGDRLVVGDKNGMIELWDISKLK